MDRESCTVKELLRAAENKIETQRVQMETLVQASDIIDLKRNNYELISRNEFLEKEVEKLNLKLVNQSQKHEKGLTKLEESFSLKESIHKSKVKNLNNEIKLLKLINKNQGSEIKNLKSVIDQSNASDEGELNGGRKKMSDFHKRIKSLSATIERLEVKNAKLIETKNHFQNLYKKEMNRNKSLINKQTVKREQVAYYEQLKRLNVKTSSLYNDSNLDHLTEKFSRHLRGQD